MRNSVVFILLLLLLTGCYNKPSQPATTDIAQVSDTAAVADNRYYGEDYNFVVTADSLVLQEYKPMHLLIVPDQTDSVVVRRHDHLVVAQIEIIPEDSIDSVWVKVARDQDTQGWVHESTLLHGVVPDDPISMAIHAFSDSHVLFAVAALFLVLVTWLTRRMRRERYHMVHVDDIASPFPMLLCLTMTASAVFYASIQHFAPEAWEAFYFDPTLNPFGQSRVLSAFLISSWLMVILAIASVDEIFRCLNAAEAVLYTLSLVAILAVLYIVFSISTLYYVGYPLAVLYMVAAVYQYMRRHRANYQCARCGARMHNRGACPKCGVINE